MRVFNYVHPVTGELECAMSLDDISSELSCHRLDGSKVELLTGSKLRYLILVHPDLPGSIRAGALGEELCGLMRVSDLISELLFAASVYFHRS